jgi:Arc/MetJ-type ribon-helix-helix transcriptional regulator
MMSSTMKKMMVYLPDEMHEGLRQLAFDHRTSIAELIRRAVDAAYGEILEDIRDADAELVSYRADPSSAISLEDLLAKLEGRVPRRARIARPART